MAVPGRLRHEVLSVYRQILRLSRSWQASVESETVPERGYIQEEARRLFKRNAQVASQPAL